MAFDDPELVAEFVAESREHLADVEGQLLEIEAAGENIDVDRVNTVFRAVHSIKGAAGFLGLATINQLAHSLENVLGKIRNRELIPDAAIVDVMLRAADALNGLINAVDGSNEADVSDHVTALDHIHARGEAVSAGAFPNAVRDEAAAPGAGKAGNAAAAEPDGETPARAAGSEPDGAAASEPPRSARPAEENKPAASLPGSGTEPAHPAPAAPRPAAGKKPPSSPSSKPAAPPHIDTSIRVHVGVLDRLMNLAGELVLGRNQLMQSLGTDGHSGIDAVAARLDQAISKLQEAVMQTRMQSIGSVFGKFPRVIRDLSNRLGKQCELVIDGKEVEVDKTIVEAIGDPLTHLVRNCVDHGIEPPDMRQANGKRPTGTVELRAFHQAGKVCIAITDDGAGIDGEKLKKKAVAKGVLTAEQAEALSQREAIRLIFHPGFSTAEQLSDVSGRGVGMDVVRTNIEKLGGTVEVETEVGRGTTIRITLPLTLAIIPSMIIHCGEERFAIPQVNIVELVRVRPADRGNRIRQIRGARLLKLRGDLLPLVELDAALGFHAGKADPSDGKAIHVVVVESGQTRYGLVVDGIDDSVEIVVKPLGRHLKQSDCLAGATILGDGHVAPILDIAGIANHSNLHDGSGGGANQQEDAEPRRSEDVQALLFFHNAPQDHFAVPMSLVARIERVRADQIDSVGGQLLLQYRGASLQLIRLEDHIQAAAPPEVDRLYVVVFQVHGHEAGVVACELDDIRETSVTVDDETFREPGVAGSFVVDEKTARLIDLYEVAQAAYPNWFTAKEHAQSEEVPTRVLLAEDSTFFRKRVTSFLEDDGYQVVGCEDGQAAWELLQSGEHDVQLVITDIEMPRMDGFQLCQRIKEDPQLAGLPVLALTSLSSDADRERGRRVGVDEYHVKIDREKVLEAVSRLIAAASRRSGAGGRAASGIMEGVR